MAPLTAFVDPIEDMVCWGLRGRTFASIFTAMLHYVLFIRIRTVYNVIKTVVVFLYGVAHLCCASFNLNFEMAAR